MIEPDPFREDRILMEAVVDAYGPEEQAIGWYYYLERELSFPFRARCGTKRATSAAKVDEVYEIVGMADVEECDDEMYVMARFEEDLLAMPLSQLDPLAETDEETREAVLDWKYWTDRGYSFG